jgi:hypothetical protein
MAGSYVDFVESLVYGTGLAPDPNHEDWLAANPAPDGLQWLEHHVDRMLPALEQWLVDEGLPPLTSWDGVRRAPWDPALDLALPATLDGSFTGVATLADLGAALRDRLTTVSAVASELASLLKAPFSYRYWAYLSWARDLRDRFQGVTVFPRGVLYDRDGTILSAAPFCDVFNDLHRNWHVNPSASMSVTPELESTAGQRTGRGVPGLTSNEEFLQFHRDHLALFHRWLARTEQPLLRPQDMGRAGGWPPTGPPAVVNPPSPWTYDEASMAASDLPDETDVDDVGAIEFGYHVSGHVTNTDIGPLSHNNYTPRFHNWHGWIDSQWWWREPRFAESDPVTGERTRIFRPVLQDSTDFPEPFAISIVRDLAAAEDEISPADAVGGIDLATGDGSLRVKLYVRDPLGRALRLRLTADVLDAAGAVVPGAGVTVDRDIGPGGDHSLDAEFTEDLALTGAFVSDDPARANAAVGFVNARIRVTGILWVPDAAAPDDPAASPDAGFVHEDSFTVDLVREKLGPEVLVYQDIASFSDDQVTSAMDGGVAAFDDAFFVVAQDRATSPVPAPTWPVDVADEVKGLVLPRTASAGLFDDEAHAPEVVLWQELVDAPFTEVTVRLQGPPAKEDATLSEGLPQRFTWRYAIDFGDGNDAFDGLGPGDQRLARLRVTVTDRAGNASTVETPVKLFVGANPYMRDGTVPWLSVDTRSFAIREGETRLGETISAGQPLQFLEAVLDGLNAGTTGAETFDTLAAEGPEAALEYASEIEDFEDGTSQAVYNFALAKVRLQGAAGAEGVRAFFRLFRYAEPSLLFSEASGYRFFADGAGRAVPLPGFESESAGSPLRSMPFFASERVDPAADSLETQEDPLNVHTFPPGPTDERVWYFGAWLDFNDPSVRLPGAFQGGTPNGPYAAPLLEPLETLMRDFHQCMVVEIRYDEDPTDPGASPSASDNLAQRNLAILSSANPGDEWTRTVEQAFELDLSRPPAPDDDVDVVLDEGPGGHDECANCGHDAVDDDFLCTRCGSAGVARPLRHGDPLGFVSSFRFARLVDEEALSLAMRTPHDEGHEHGEDHEHDHDHGHDHGDGPAHGAVSHPHAALVPQFRPQAARNVRRAFPFVFHPSRWTQTAELLDELMLDWGNMPEGAEAELFLPDVAPEDVVNLRNLRHAPATVLPQGGATLRLRVGGVTFVPLPPVRGNRLAGALRIRLPEGVKAPSRYVADVTHLRAGAVVRNGGFRVEIDVAHAPELVRRAATQVVKLHGQLAAAPAGDRWRPVLERRLRTERLRARGLAEDAGVEWVDPTVWTDENGVEHPVSGRRIRVVLERILVVDDSDPKLKGAGEIDFDVLVRTDDNGGREEHTRLPAHGHFTIGSGESLEIGEAIFEGFVEDDLAVGIRAMERDTFDPDDNLGSYVRTFSCAVDDWIGAYGPGDERIDPEDVGHWQVFYRIERA